MPVEIETIYQLFAELLDYPAPGLGQSALEFARRVEPYSPQAASALSGFAELSQRASLGFLEEAYTSAFDLKAAFQPYVGYHLFGDTYQRSLFLVGLSERYNQYAFSSGKELPDHLRVMLRFLSLCPDPVMKAELIQEALLPALQRMIQPMASEEREDEETTPAIEPDAGQNVYRPLLVALAWLLQAVSTVSEGEAVR